MNIGHFLEKFGLLLVKMAHLLVNIQHLLIKTGNRLVKIRHLRVNIGHLLLKSGHLRMKIAVKSASYIRLTVATSAHPNLGPLSLVSCAVLIP